MPETYLITWIFISTPIITIILFLLGYVFYFVRFIKRFIKIKERSIFNDLWRSNNEQKDFIIFFILTFFYFTFLVLNAPFYNGWRLVYFLNIFIVYFCVYQINNFFIFFRKNNLKRTLISFVTIILITYNIICLIIYHPYESYYFSQFITKVKKNSFESDYHGLAAKEFFLKLSSENKDKIMKIAVASHTPLHRGLEGIDKNLRKKFKVIGQDYKNADFIYKNNISEVNPRLNKKYNIPNNFGKVYELNVNGVIIYEIYKNINIK